MPVLEMEAGVVSSAGVVQLRRNPRAPNTESERPWFHLRTPDGRYLNLDGTGFTSGPYRYIGTEAQARAMMRRGGLAAECVAREA